MVDGPRGIPVVHCTVEQYLPLVTALRDEGYDMCVDVTAVDYLAHPGRSSVPAGVETHRFEVVTQLLSLTSAARVRIRVHPQGDQPIVPSLFDLYPGSEAMEREAFDLLGIRFEGHPDLTRILMPEDWEGHPLRKDYAQGRVPVQFKAAPSTRTGSSR